MDLDRWIAENVMGWYFRGTYYKTSPESKFIEQWTDHWHPTTDIAQAFEVVEKMRENDFWFSLSYKTERINDRTHELDPGWYARFRCVSGGARKDGYADAETPALAICKAAKAAGLEG